MTLAKRALVQADYEGVDITQELQKDLLSFEYVDNASGDADSISINLKDEKHIWLKDWFPEKGDVINPKIKTINWKKDGEEQVLPCGRFFIDAPSYSGRPSTFTLDAISSPLNSNFSDAGRSKMWKNITLKKIAKDIAGRYGLSLQYLGNNNPKFDVKEQDEESDSSFLSEICGDEGLAMKVTDSSIVIFDESEFEKRVHVRAYKEWGSEVLSYDFDTSLKDTKYDGVNVKYHEPKTGRVIEFLYAPGGSDEDSKIYQINKRVQNEIEARRLAQKTFQRLNKKEVTCSLEVVGNLEILGAVTIMLEGFGYFSGKYYVNQATHAVGSGFKTSIEARRVQEG